MQVRPALRSALAAGVVLVVDQLTKALVRRWIPVGTSHPVIDGVLDLTHLRNTGAAFGIFPGGMAWFMLAAVVVLAGIVFVWWRHAPQDGWTAVSLGLIAGGAAGNLVDRALLGAVTDFFDVHVWPVFNLADVALDVGVAILVMRLVFAHDRRDEPEGGEAHGSQVADAGPSGEADG